MPVRNRGLWLHSHISLAAKQLLSVLIYVYLFLGSIVAAAEPGNSTMPKLQADANSEPAMPSAGIDVAVNRAASPDAPDIEWEVASLRSVFHTEEDGDGDSKVSMGEYSFSFAAPVIRTAEHKLLLHTSIDIVDFDIDADKSAGFETDLEDIDRLYELEMGVQYLHQLNNGWHIGTGLRVTTRGDDLFASDDEVFLHPNFELTIPHMENNAWLIGIGYESDQDQIFPIAGYKLRWGEKNVALIGFPGGLYHQKVSDDIALDVKYLLPYDGEIKLTYDIPESAFSIYSAFSSKTHRWAIADRDDDDERLYYWDKRCEAGVTYEPREHFVLKASVGCAFDRRLSEGDEIDEDDRELEIDNSMFAGIQLSISF